MQNQRIKQHQILTRRSLKSTLKMPKEKQRKSYIHERSCRTIITINGSIQIIATESSSPRKPQSHKSISGLCPKKINNRANKWNNLSIKWVVVFFCWGNCQYSVTNKYLSTLKCSTKIAENLKPTSIKPQTKKKTNPTSVLGKETDLMINEFIEKDDFIISRSKRFPVTRTHTLLHSVFRSANVLTTLQW